MLFIAIYSLDSSPCIIFQVKKFGIIAKKLQKRDWSYILKWRFHRSCSRRRRRRRRVRRRYLSSLIWIRRDCVSNHVIFVITLRMADIQEITERNYRQAGVFLKLIDLTFIFLL